MKINRLSKLVALAAHLKNANALPSLGPPRTIRSGNYNIEECGFQGPVVETILQHMQGFLQPLIRNSNVNQPAYQAFFGGVSPERIQEVFGRIAAGTNITLNGLPPQPGIVCVSPGTMHNGRDCKENSVVLYRSAVALCPSFFNLPLLETTCGTTNAAKTRMISKVADSQYNVLVYALAFVYVGQILGQTPTFPFIGDVNKCITATPSQKFINPPNYYLYASSMLANCKDFPASPVYPPDRDRELLEASNSEAVANSSTPLEDSN